MMANGIRISKETFGQLDSETKLDAIFDVLVSIHSQCTCRMDTCEKRFKQIENRKLRDKGIAGTAGLVGGFIAQIFQKIAGGSP